MNKPEFLGQTSATPFKPRYENFIGGQWVAPLGGRYFDNTSPINGRKITEVPRSQKEDIELALDAAHAAKVAWGRSSVAARALILNQIADRIEQNLDLLALAETWDNGKPIRETTNADVPLAVDHFRYFAGAIRAQEGSLSELDHDTVAYHFHEPLGVVGQIIPWNFPLLMAVWKLAPALAAGNCVVLKPAEQTPASILVLVELIADLLPPGVLNVVNGFGLEAGKPLASSNRIAKIAFTGETTTGRLIMQYASQNLIPVTLELGGKSPNIFFSDVMAADDDFFDKAIEGFLIYLYDQGEVCASPTRALVAEEIYEPFMARVKARIARVGIGHPLEMTTGIGAITSKAQFDKIMGYLELGKQEGAKVIHGGNAYNQGDGGYYIEPTILEGTNDMRTSREEIFGPITSVIRFKTEEEALRLANDSPYGLTAGVWTRDYHQMQRFARGLEVGKVWCNCYYLWPSHTSFGGYKNSGFGREMHKSALNNYRHTKSIVHSYGTQAFGFF